MKLLLEREWSTTTNSITIKNLKSNTEYKFSILAKDAAGNKSQPTSIIVKQMMLTQHLLVEIAMLPFQSLQIGEVVTTSRL